MDSITRTPHDLNTKFHACKTYDNGNFSVRSICRKYKVSKASLMRWMNRFDGTRESLINKSKRPKSIHPRAHTVDEITWIKNLIRRNPHIGLSELYGKLRVNKGYSRHACSLFRFLRKHGFIEDKRNIKIKRINKPYDTPKDIAVKMQLDVKFVPKECYTGSDPLKPKFYQYTIIDEASRERFIYHYDEYSATNTVDFVKRAIIYYGYIPQIIQTDNGFEFTHFRETRRIHPFDVLCDSMGITHKLIRPRTPRHNGKVERSHRNDNERFYNYLSFYSLDDLRKQAKPYLKRSNSIPSSPLKWLSPFEVRASLTTLKHNNRAFNHLFHDLLTTSL